MIVKIGRVELTEAEAGRLYFDNKYIVQYRDIYALHYSNAQERVYGTLIYKADEPLTKRGRFFAMSAEDVNHLIGFTLIKED